MLCEIYVYTIYSTHANTHTHTHAHAHAHMTHGSLAPLGLLCALILSNHGPLRWARLLSTSNQPSHGCQEQFLQRVCVCVCVIYVYVIYLTHTHTHIRLYRYTVWRQRRKTANRTPQLPTHAITGGRRWVSARPLLARSRFSPR